MSLYRLAAIVIAILGGTAFTVSAYVESRLPAEAQPAMVAETPATASDPQRAENENHTAAHETSLEAEA